jgi:N-acetylglutamate synthase-like GNAT family acetyltransferase
MSNISYRKIISEDKDWIKKFIQKYWGSEQIVVHKTKYYPSILKGFLAESSEEKIGLITYKIENKKCEIVTLNSLKENKGIGSQLVNLVIEEAKEKDCKKVWLITTNDNIKAIYFYQKLGFQLKKVYPNAVEESRRIKPEIPLVNEEGIPIRDELKFQLEIKAI